MNYCFTLLALHSYKTRPTINTWYTIKLWLGCDFFLKSYTYYCWKLHWHCRTSLCVAGMAEWDMEQCQRQPLYQKQNLKKEKEKQILQKSLKTKVGRGKKPKSGLITNCTFLIARHVHRHDFRQVLALRNSCNWGCRETGISGPKQSPNASRLDRTVHFSTVSVIL